MEQFRICFDNTTECYFPGETISGAFVANLKNRIEFRELVLTFSGKGYCQWSNGKIDYGNAERYFKEDQVLIEASPQGNNFLGPGVSSFRFCFQLPESIPPSFIFCGFQSKAKVKYKVSAAFTEVKWLVTSRNIIKKFEFGVTSLQFDSNVIPDLPEATNTLKHKYLCCLCCQTGPVVIVLQLNKDVFNAGTTIVFDVEVDNKATTRTLGKIKVQLVKLVVLLDGKGNKATYSYPTSSIVLAQTILPGGEENWRNVFLHIPSDLEPTTENSRCVNLTYTLVLTAKIPSGVNASVRLPVRVLPTMPTTLPPHALPHHIATRQQPSLSPVITQPITYEPSRPYQFKNLQLNESCRPGE